MLDPKRVRRLLLIRFSAVGDVINTLPALAAVRKALPEAFIGFAVEDRAKDLIVGHPQVDRIHLYERKRWVRQFKHPTQWYRTLREIARYLAEIRRERYDALIDFQGNFKSAAHDFLAGVPRRIGFPAGHSMEWNHVFTNIHVPPPGNRINRVEKFLSLVKGLGIHVNGARYMVPESPASARAVEDFLRLHDIGEGEYVVVHPGTSEFGKAKRWSIDRFGELIRLVRDRYGLSSVVTWGPGEREMAQEVVSRSEGAAVLALETRSILDLAEMIRRARLFVGCDTGPLHLASAVQAPSVALFGPKDPAVYGPYNPMRRVIYKPDGAGSMNAILVDDVIGAVDELLGEEA